MKRIIIKYVTEFIVVFLGVTLSFALQEYGKTKENLSQQKNGYLNVLQDLEADEEIFRVTISVNNLQKSAAQSILDGEINNDLFNLTFPYFGTLLNDTGIKSITSSGIIGDFKNQKLISQILRYYRNDYDLIIDQSVMDETFSIDRRRFFHQTVKFDSVSENYPIDFGDLPSKNFDGLKISKFFLSESQLQMVANNPIYQAELNNLIYTKNAFNSFIQLSLERNRELQTLVRKEIDSY